MKPERRTAHWLAAEASVDLEVTETLATVTLCMGDEDQKRWVTTLDKFDEAVKWINAVQRDVKAEVEHLRSAGLIPELGKCFGQD